MFRAIINLISNRNNINYSWKQISGSDYANYSSLFYNSSNSRLYSAIYGSIIKLYLNNNFYQFSSLTRYWGKIKVIDDYLFAIISSGTADYIYRFSLINGAISCTFPSNTYWSDILKTPNSILASVIVDNPGIYRSTDYGTTYTKLNTPGSGFSKLAILGNRIFAIAYDRYICYSDNDGTTWNTINSLGTGDWRFLYTYKGNIYTGKYGESIYKSTDKGITWSALPLGNRYWQDIIICNGNMFLSTNTNVLKSIDEKTTTVVSELSGGYWTFSGDDTVAFAAKGSSYIFKYSPI